MRKADFRAHWVSGNIFPKQRLYFKKKSELKIDPDSQVKPKFQISSA